MNRWLLLLLVLTPTLLQVTQPGSFFARAEEDEVEDETIVEDEGAEQPEEEIELGKKNVSPDVDTTIFFTKPTVNPAGVELPGGQIAEFLIGFSNKGDQEMVIETLDASFRYPMDFTYHIQNFTTMPFQRVVKPKEEATVAYSFIPADAFAGRPIGLSVNLAYRDAAGNFYLDPVFNETVQVTEFDEGFDTEVFFMYVFIVAGALLVLFLVASFLQGKAGKGKKPAPVRRAKTVETGTAGDDVDYEWIPRSALRTPGGTGSNKTSPRQRKGRKGAASSDEE